MRGTQGRARDGLRARGASDAWSTGPQTPAMCRARGKRPEVTRTRGTSLRTQRARACKGSVLIFLRGRLSAQPTWPTHAGRGSSARDTKMAGHGGMLALHLPRAQSRGMS